MEKLKNQNVLAWDKSTSRRARGWVVRMLRAFEDRPGYPWKKIRDRKDARSWRLIGVIFRIP